VIDTRLREVFLCSPVSPGQTQLDSSIMGACHCPSFRVLGAPSLTVAKDSFRSSAELASPSRRWGRFEQSSTRAVHNAGHPPSTGGWPPSMSPKDGTERLSQGALHDGPRQAKVAGSSLPISGCTRHTEHC
jgi:hypothetical protein